MRLAYRRAPSRDSVFRASDERPSEQAGGLLPMRLA